MASKKTKKKTDLVFKNPDANLETIDIIEAIGDKFGKYSEYVISSRSVPDVRDGLLPVHRRNLYGMFKKNWSSKKPYTKSAKIVGEIMGTYHPHGDSSIYGSLARMSMEWAMGIPMIDMGGNNGSIDGDSPAAMRYTESRLSAYSEDLLLSNLSLKGIVPMRYNYDDTTHEPVYLPAKVPNILVNGSEGIAVGYASNIPPFNLNEVIEACIQDIENPKITADEVLDIIPSPDFPTGGVIADYKGYKDVLKKGQGSFKVRGKYRILEYKKEKEIHIDFYEIPYGAKKPKILNTINEAVLKREIIGIKEAKDDSNTESISLKVICSDQVDPDVILAYLFSKTDLQLNVPLNLTVISRNKPRTLGIHQVIREFNIFRKEVFIKGLEIQIKELQAKQHLNEGYVMLVDNIEEVIKIIKGSSSKKDGFAKLVKFGFSEIQAQKILDLSLHRINKSDKSSFEKTVKECIKGIKQREKILNSDSLTNKAIVQAYRGIQESYPTPRKTELKAEPEIWSFSPELLIPKENVAIGITEDGFIKASNFRSYKSSTNDNNELKYVIETDTTKNIILVTSEGKSAYIPVHKLTLSRWSDEGKHLSTLGFKIGQEKIAFATEFDGSDKDKIVFLLKNTGYAKNTLAFDYVKQQGHFSLVAGMRCKEGEEVIAGYLLDKDDEKYLGLIDSNFSNMYLNPLDVPTASPKGSGTIAMKVKKGAEILEYKLFDKKSDIPKFCKERERGKSGWTRTKKEGSVSFE